jgi:hypothetical protein
MNEHDPDPEYVEHLEWQLTTALRRNARFARPVSGRAAGVLRTAALMLVCLSGGAGVVIGAEHLQQSREVELMLARNTVQVETATRLFEGEQERVARAVTNHEAGLVDSRALADSRLAANEARIELDRLQLAGDEIVAGGRAPDPSLIAPLIRQRDFVSEGLRLERERFGLRLQRMESESTRTEQLVEAGLISSRERLGVLDRRSELELKIRSVDERLELRGNYLLGRQDARSTTLLELQLSARILLERAERSIESLRLRHQRLEELFEAGMVQEAERAKAEAALRRSEKELEMKRKETEVIFGAF